MTCSSSTLTSEDNFKEEFFEDKLCLSSSEFYNNSSFSNDSCKKSAKTHVWTYPKMQEKNNI